MGTGTGSEGDNGGGVEDDTSEIDCTSCGYTAVVSTSVSRHEIRIKGFTSTRRL